MLSRREQLLMIMNPLLGSGGGGGGWLPTDLTALAAWYDASDETTLYTDAGSTQVTADDDLVYQENDKSGNNHHKRQTTESLRPKYKTGIQNSLSVCRYDGSDDYLRSIDSLGIAQPNTVFIVAKGDDTAYHFFYCSSNNQFLRNTGSGGIQAYAGSGIGAVGVSVAQHIMAGVFNDASSSFYIDGGVAAATGDVDTNALGILTTGADLNGANNNACDICEEVYCDSVLSTADMNLLGNYLGTKWDISWADIT